MKIMYVWIVVNNLNGISKNVLGARGAELFYLKVKLYQSTQ